MLMKEPWGEERKKVILILSCLLYRYTCTQISSTSLEGYWKSLCPEMLRPNSVVEQQCSEKEEIFPGITGKTFHHEKKETAA